MTRFCIDSNVLVYVADAEDPRRQSSAQELLVAIDESNAGRFQFFDALLLATAAAAGCTHVISEDMANGAKLGSIQVIAAFDATGSVAPGALALLAG